MLFCGALWVLACLASCATPAQPVAQVGDPYTATTQAGMKVLRARLMTEQLESCWSIDEPVAPLTIGEEMDLVLRMKNPFAQMMTMIEPSQGFIVQIDWRIERWMPYAGAEVLRHRQIATLDRLLMFAAGEEILYPVTLPLGTAADPSAVWRVTLRATLRADGLQLDDDELPVGKIRFQKADFLVLPGNWKSIAEEPLATIQRLVTIADARVDRHMLVAAALIGPADREAALETLVTRMPEAPNLRRIDTMMAALRYLTGRDFGEHPDRWKRWWEKRKIGEL